MFIKVRHLLVTLYHQFFEDHCPSRAASLAYATLLSLVPLLMVSVYILSWFPDFKSVGPAFQHYILSNFVADSATTISQYLNDFLAHLKDLSLVNIGFLGLISIFMIYNMVSAFNEIWHVKMEIHFAIAMGIYLLVLLFAPLLLGILVILLSYFSSLSWLSLPAMQHVIKQPFFRLLPYLCEWVVFTFFNWALPSTRVRFRYALVAGFMTMLLFELAKFGFAYYVHYVPTYRLIYGALATIPVFLIWLYVSWLIILLGAVMCHLMSCGLSKRRI